MALATARQTRRKRNWPHGRFVTAAAAAVTARPVRTRRRRRLRNAGRTEHGHAEKTIAATGGRRRAMWCVGSRLASDSAFRLPLASRLDRTQPERMAASCEHRLEETLVSCAMLQHLVAYGILPRHLLDAATHGTCLLQRHVPLKYRRFGRRTMTCVDRRSLQETFAITLTPLPTATFYLAGAMCENLV